MKLYYTETGVMLMQLTGALRPAPKRSLIELTDEQAAREYVKDCVAKKLLVEADGAQRAAWRAYKERNKNATTELLAVVESATSSVTARAHDSADDSAKDKDDKVKVKVKAKSKRSATT